MELRKDPITRSWVIVGGEVEEAAHAQSGACPYCPGANPEPQVVSYLPALDGGPWSPSVRSVVHPSPLYRIEGDPQRRGDGLYDTMQSVGAHEVLIETPRHDRRLWEATDQEVSQVLLLAAHRIQDLKRDTRFKYVTFFKNQGDLAGQEFDHPSSQITATTYVPRRVLYELRAAKEFYADKERCVFCDVLAQELKDGSRIVETRGDYVACCPYAPRVPYETWIMPRAHEASFERAALAKGNTVLDLAILLRRTLRRILGYCDSFHLVLHTVPNHYQKQAASLNYWRTIDDDYHWHIEILPVISKKAKSYFLKEIYYSPVKSEVAVQRLREVNVN